MAKHTEYWYVIRKFGRRFKSMPTWRYKLSASPLSQLRAAPIRAFSVIVCSPSCCNQLRCRISIGAMLFALEVLPALTGKIAKLYICPADVTWEKQIESQACVSRRVQCYRHRSRGTTVAEVGRLHLMRIARALLLLTHSLVLRASVCMQSQRQRSRTLELVIIQ